MNAAEGSQTQSGPGEGDTMDVEDGALRQQDIARRGVDRFASVISRIERMAAGGEVFLCAVGIESLSRCDPSRRNICFQDDGSGDEEDGEMRNFSDYEEMEGFIDDEELWDQERRRKTSTGHCANDFKSYLGGERGTPSESMSRDGEESRDSFDVPQGKRRTQAELGEAAKAAVERLRVAAREHTGARKIPPALYPQIVSAAMAMKEGTDDGNLVKAHYETILSAMPFKISEQAVRKRVKELLQNQAAGTQGARLEDAIKILRPLIQAAVAAQEEARAAVEVSAARVREENAQIRAAGPGPGEISRAPSAESASSTDETKATAFVPGPGGGAVLAPVDEEAGLEGADSMPPPSVKEKKLPTYKFKWNKDLDDAWLTVMQIEEEHVTRVAKTAKPTKKGDATPTAEAKADAEKKAKLKGMTSVYKKWVDEWPMGWIIWTELRSAHHRIVKAIERQHEKESGGKENRDSIATKRKAADVAPGEKKAKKVGEGKNGIPVSSPAPAPAVAVVVGPKMGIVFDPIPSEATARWALQREERDAASDATGVGDLTQTIG